MHEQIAKYDLSNRFPTYTWNERIVGDLHIFEAVNGSTIVASAKAGSLEDAVNQVRQTLLGCTDFILARITEVQRNACTGIIAGQMIYNTDGTAECYNGTAWDPM